MKVDGSIPMVELRTLLQFEAQHHGLNIRYKERDLREHENGVFYPQAEVIAHYGEETLKFKVDLAGKELRLEGDVHFPQGEVLFAHDQPLAVLQGRHLFLAFSPELVGGDDPGRTVNQLFGPILDQAMPRIAEYIDNYDYAPEAKQYAETRAETDRLRCQYWRSDLTTNEREIEQKASDLRELYLKNDELRALIGLWEYETGPKRKHRFMDEYRALMRMRPEALSKVTFDDFQLKVVTRPIFIDYDGYEYDLGEYEISLRFRDGDLRIKEVDESEREFPHPHVSRDGVPCLGNLADGVQKLLAEGDYAGLIQVMLRFLESYNRENPYLKLEAWNPDYSSLDDELERMESCFESVGDRDCVDCGDRDCPYNDGAADRCFENRTTMECITCAVTCDYHRTAINTCRGEHAYWECVDCGTRECEYANDPDECFESHDGDECCECPLENCRNRKEEDDEG